MALFPVDFLPELLDGQRILLKDFREIDGLEDVRDGLAVAVRRVGHGVAFDTLIGLDCDQGETPDAGLARGNAPVPITRTRIDFDEAAGQSGDFHGGSIAS